MVVTKNFIIIIIIIEISENIFLILSFYLIYLNINLIN